MTVEQELQPARARGACEDLKAIRADCGGIGRNACPRIVDRASGEGEACHLETGLGGFTGEHFERGLFVPDEARRRNQIFEQAECSLRMIFDRGVDSGLHQPFLAFQIYDTWKRYIVQTLYLYGPNRSVALRFG